jgi:hypothetical protein
MYKGSPHSPRRDTKWVNVLDIPDVAYFGDGQDLVGVHFDAVLGDDVTQELSPGDLEGAFFLV